MYFHKGEKTLFSFLYRIGMGLPSKSHSLRSRRKTREFSCNKGISGTRQNGAHAGAQFMGYGLLAHASLPRASFFLAPVFSFSLRCVLSSLRPQSYGGRGTILSCACYEMGWPNLHGYFPVPPFLFTTGNPCWIPVVDWHSAIKRVTSLNSTEIKGMSLVRSSH